MAVVGETVTPAGSGPKVRVMAPREAQVAGDTLGGHVAVMPMTTLWGGRYTGVTDALMWRFNASIAVDARMAQVDFVVWGNSADIHADILCFERRELFFFR